MDQFLGILYRDWINLLKEVKYDFAKRPSQLNRVLFIALKGLVNNRTSQREKEQFFDRYKNAKIEAPVFVVGHWRSGTTLLHYLISQDSSLTYPTIFQISNPRSFLLQEDQIYIMARNRPARKRTMDNVQFSPDSPAEDEFALCAMTTRSPLVSWSFPSHEQFYDRYLDMCDVPQDGMDRWQQEFLLFLKRISWKYQKPLLLKSPTHTARMGLLLQLFPDARFVHVSRDPYAVFQSTLRLYHTGIQKSYLQKAPSEAALQESIFARYNRMYDAYFRDLDGIPPDRICEVKFEELEKDKLGQVARVYDQLGLPDFDRMEPRLRSYVDSLKDYKKTSHSSLTSEQRKQVAENWQRSFARWDYAI